MLCPKSTRTKGGGGLKLLRTFGVQVGWGDQLFAMSCGRVLWTTNRKYRNRKVLSPERSQLANDNIQEHIWFKSGQSALPRWSESDKVGCFWTEL